MLKTSSLSALLLVAAAFTMPSGSAFAKDIVLGASVQLTGPVANTGRYYRDAYQLAIDKINAAGGVKVGNESHKLALKLYDNQSDVNLSVRQYTQLVSQDKVDFLLGPFASNFALADSAVSEKYKIPMVQGGGASDQIFARNFKYIFGTLAPASNYFGSTVDMLKGLNPAPKSVALLYADDAFDVSVAEGTRPKLKQAGLTLGHGRALQHQRHGLQFAALADQKQEHRCGAGRRPRNRDPEFRAAGEEPCGRAEDVFLHGGRSQRGFPQGAGQGRRLRFRHDGLAAFGRTEGPLVWRRRAVRCRLQGEVWL